MDIEEVKKQAEEELQEDLFREAVEKYKIKLRTKRSFIDRLIPFKILIIRKEY